MIAEKIPGVQALSLQEKLLLANELWDQVETDQGDPFVDIVEMLDRRYAEYQRDPSTAVRWDDFKLPFSRSE